jgi:N-methylhydantoinase A
VLLPLLDVHTVGAGGGSIAGRDESGLLRVGPESAGADPGPACYGHGGPATVTDALVVLGRIPGDSLAGGTLPLDRAAAERVLAALARALGLKSALAAAEGVVRLAEARIEAALRTVSVERGHDPRGAALVAFGGAGGLHACAVAEALGVSAVLAPPDAGMLSALGALTGGMRREAGRSVLIPAGETARLEAEWNRLERRVRAGFPAATRPRVERWAEMRYAGQSHELSVRAGAGLADRFHREHARRFGFAERGRAVEVVTVEVRASLPGERSRRRVAGTGRPRSAGRTRVRDRGRWVMAALWDREMMGQGFTTTGPAIVVESGATLWVPARWRARMHPTGTLVLQRGAR